MSSKALYTRPKTLRDGPTHYCPGCGHGTLHKLLAEVVDELDLREKLVGIAPVGCSVIAYDYLDLDMCEAAHGRAPAVATGMKRACPDLLVLSYQGDGDLASIGMAETIHAANRGENFTTLFINNTIYGMTGGQMAPTTLLGQQTVTTPTGRDEVSTGYPIRICELLDTLDAPYFIQRTAIDSPGGIVRTKQALIKALQYQIEGRGYTFVEVLTTCPTYWHMSPRDAMQHITDAVSKTFPTKLFRDRGEE